MQASYAWQQATAANNIVQMQQPHAPKGHAQTMGPPHGGRMQGKPNKRLRQKTKPLGKHEKGQPTQMPQDFFEAMPLPKGAREYPKSKGPIPGYRTVSRPTQEEERAKKAMAAAMAVHDGLDASMPMDQRKMLYGNAKPTAPVGQLYHKFRAL